MPTLISCTHTEDGSACNDCQNQDLAEALSEPEREEVVEGVVKKIIAEVDKRKVEELKRIDKEIDEIVSRWNYAKDILSKLT